MGCVLSIDARRGDELIAMVHMVITAEHFMIPFFPVFKSVAGGPQPDGARPSAGDR